MKRHCFFEENGDSSTYTYEVKDNVYGGDQEAASHA